LEFNVPFQRKYGYVRDELIVANTTLVLSIEITEKIAQNYDM